MVMDFAAAVNEEAHELQAAGADVIQIDDPWLRNDPDAAKRIAVRALDRAPGGAEGADRGAPVLRLRRVVPKDKPVGYSSCRSLPAAPPIRFPSRRHSPSSISAS